MAKQAQAAAQGIPDDIAAMSFEAAMAELERIVQRLESGDVDLEDSISIYGRGALLKQHCEAKLKSAAEKIEKIVADDGGNAVAAEPVDQA